MDAPLKTLLRLQWTLYRRAWTPLALVNLFIVYAGAWFLLSAAADRWGARLAGLDAHAARFWFLLAVAGVPVLAGVPKAVRSLYEQEEVSFLLTGGISPRGLFQARCVALAGGDFFWAGVICIAAWHTQPFLGFPRLFPLMLTLSPVIALTLALCRLSTATIFFHALLRWGKTGVPLTLALAGAILFGTSRTPAPALALGGLILLCAGAAPFLVARFHADDFSGALVRGNRQSRATWRALSGALAWLPATWRAQVVRDGVVLLRGGFPRALLVCAFLFLTPAIFWADFFSAPWRGLDFASELRLCFYVVFQTTALSYALGFDFLKFKSGFAGYDYSLPVKPGSFWWAHFTSQTLVALLYLAPYLAALAWLEGGATATWQTAAVKLALLASLITLHGTSFALSNFTGETIPTESQYGMSAGAVGILATLGLCVAGAWWPCVVFLHLAHFKLYVRGLGKLRRMEVAS